MNRTALVDSAGFHVIRFFAYLQLQSTALLAGSTRAWISEASRLFANQLDRALARDANRFAGRFADLLADKLGFADRTADLLANRLGAALFNLLAGRYSAVLVAGFANWLADSL